MNANIPTAVDFQKELSQIFQNALEQGHKEIIVVSGELHRRVGGYPSKNHRMPVCCQVMRSAMRPGDQILAAPPKGDGAILKIIYILPRK